MRTQVRGLVDPTLAVQSALVGLHDLSGLPWWATLVAGTCAVRVALFPVIVYQQRQQSRLRNLRPVLRAVSESCKHIPDLTRRQGALIGGMWRECVRHGVHPMSLFVAPLVQVPVFLTCVVSVRRMLERSVVGPADGGALAPTSPHDMSTGGAVWFSDLTAADPYAVLPICTIGLFLVSTELSGAGATMPPWMEFLKRRLQDGGLIALPAFAAFPAGVFMYWVPNNLISLVQTQLTRLPRVRMALALDPPPGQELLPSSAGGDRRTTTRQAVFAQARAFEAEGQIQAAAETYRGLVQEEPGDPKAVLALTRLLRASPSEEAHLMAVAVLEPLVAMVPDDPMPRIALVEALTAVGRRDDALVEAEALVVREEKNVRAHIVLASTLAPESSDADGASVYAARAAEHLETAARLASEAGDPNAADWCTREAEALRARFSEAAPSCPDPNDGDSRPAAGADPDK